MSQYKQIVTWEMNYNDLLTMISIGSRPYKENQFFAV